MDDTWLSEDDLAFMKELEEQGSLYENSDYEDYEDDSKATHSPTMHFLERAQLDIILASLFLASLCATPCICNGIFCQVYVAKVARRLCYSLVSSILRCTLATPFTNSSSSTKAAFFAKSKEDRSAGPVTDGRGPVTTTGWGPRIKCLPAVLQKRFS